MNKRVHVYVSGLVQGVFFRAAARDRARALSVGGFARNLPDGRVEIVAEAEAGRLDEFLAWCRSGPPRARVDEVTVRDEPARAEFQDFTVRY